MATHLGDQKMDVSIGEKAEETLAADTWEFKFEEEQFNFQSMDHAPRRCHCVLIYDNEEESGNREMRWELKEGVPIYLGRSNGIGTNDKLLSRKQVECLVDFEAMVVVVTRVGRLPSLNQKFQPIGAGATIEVGHLDTFWLLDDKYPIHVFIEKEGKVGSANPMDDDDGGQDDDNDDDDLISESEESGVCSGVDDDEDNQLL